MSESIVPFFPPDMFAADREVIYAQVYAAGRTNKFLLKENVRALELKAMQVSGARDAIAVHSGTGAVGVSLRAIGIGPGDEVITQGYCCQPVASEVINLGATPVFIDIEPRRFVMDPSRIERAITSRTKAILPAHLFSCLVDMPAVMEIADRHGLSVVEDACVQQGATLNGRAAGTLGHIGTWSFFQMKVMGGVGEGGMILTNDPDLGARARKLRNHGMRARFDHQYLGVNSRMDELMAGYLLHRFASFDEALEARRRVARYYLDRFAAIQDEVQMPPGRMDGACFYMFTIATPRRDSLQTWLMNHGVATHVYYPKPLSSQRGFAKYHRGNDDLSNCTRMGNEGLSLPIYPTLTDQQMKLVADQVIEFFQADADQA